MADHPRSRGVYCLVPAVAEVRDGSSPLARGLHPVGHPNSGRLGIIPARAGFTQGVGPRSHEHWDHPRSRGVYTRPLDAFALCDGSSPLARGLP